MDTTLDKILQLFKEGRLTRREAATRISGLLAALAGMNVLGRSVRANENDTLFDALDVNHVALRVSDLDNSEAFYRRTFGMSRIAGGQWNRFMRAGTNFVAMFKADKPRVDHLAFSIEPYDQDKIIDKLAKADIRHRRDMERTYLYDPDGIELQVCELDHWPVAGGRPKS